MLPISKVLLQFELTSDSTRRICRTQHYVYMKNWYECNREARFWRQNVAHDDHASHTQRHAAPAKVLICYVECNSMLPPSTLCRNTEKVNILTPQQRTGS